ncbi:rolling circle replication-associated protein [Kocuria sp. LHG3120]|uniref:rolling circle replication-associated protein n=1 Tax=Kocuria sp. LHG3120 TaxID=2804590 RepID=UPI003CE8CC39
MSVSVESSSALAAPRAGWRLSLYPDAGEGGGCFVSSYQPDRSYVAPGKGRDPKRAAEEAARRARAKLRRYCAANRLNRLGTLTYGEPRCSDPRELRAHVGLFFRDLRAELGGDPLPYVWVPELHKDGVHFHVHFAIGRYVAQPRLKAIWGRGFVHIKRLGSGPIGSGALGEARIASRYLSKYVGKTFDDPTVRVPGMHRYEVAQGFQPKMMPFFGPTSESVIEQASAVFGAAPAVRWNSDEVEQWAGAPAIWVQWDGER